MADTANNEKASTVPEMTSPPNYTSLNRQETDSTGFIHHEDPMSYRPPEQVSNTTTHERGNVMVTPLERLGENSADVDCPYCKRVVKTDPRKIDAGDNGLMMCLICLVCCPLLLCYDGDKDLDHYCKQCNRQLTHQPKCTGPVQVVANPNQQPALVASQYAQAA